MFMLIIYVLIDFVFFFLFVGERERERERAFVVAKLFSCSICVTLVHFFVCCFCSASSFNCYSFAYFLVLLSLCDPGPSDVRTNVQIEKCDIIFVSAILARCVQGAKSCTDP